jgi:hypothetical protein
MAQSIPDVFMDAAIRELITFGYYRAEPEIEVQVEDDLISFTSKSRIITFNSKASVSPPKSVPAKGLKLIEEFYEVEGKEVRAPLDIHDGATDRYCVKFKRKNLKVKEVTDTHYWLSPVTPFVVIFQHSSSHSCGVEKLTGRSLGLPPEPSSASGAGRIVYKYDCASFSGQGFSWWVRWLN